MAGGCTAAESDGGAITCIGSTAAGKEGIPFPGGGGTGSGGEGWVGGWWGGWGRAGLMGVPAGDMYHSITRQQKVTAVRSLAQAALQLSLIHISQGIVR